MSEIGLGLKPVTQFESPAIGSGVAEKAFQIRRRFIVGLDLVSLTVEGLAPVVVRFDVDMKDETVLPQSVIPFLGDVWAEVRVSAIRDFDGVSSQNAGDQCIGLRHTIRN